MSRRVLAGALAAAIATWPLAARPDIETTIVPIIGGNSDVGFGAGAFGAIARVERGVTPYLWRLELASMTTVKVDPFAVGFQDDFVVLTVPQLVPRVMRLEVRPSFTREGQLRYSGLGNASPPPEPGESRYLYARTHPALFARTRLTLVPSRLFAQLSARYTYNVLDIGPNTLLARDATAGPPKIRDALVGTSDHSVFYFEYGLVLDTRDDEVSPTKGHFHQVQLRLSPGGTDELPFRYGSWNATARGFFSPLKRRLTFAGRLVGDWQFGDVPFYELTRFEDAYAIGGSEGVRGVPAQRYYGRVKLFGNLEARSELFDFPFLAKTMHLGVAAFVDAGRVWFDGTPEPELDGTAVGLKFGTGGGLRLRAGTSFVIRADAAYSPDAYPFSFYFQGNHIF